MRHRIRNIVPEIAYTVQKEPVNKQAKAPGLRSVSSETRTEGFRS